MVQPRPQSGKSSRILVLLFFLFFFGSVGVGLSMLLCSSTLEIEGFPPVLVVNMGVFARAKPNVLAPRANTVYFPHWEHTLRVFRSDIYILYNIIYIYI